MGLQVYLHTVKMRVVCVHAYRVAGLSLSFQYLEDTLKDSRARILIFFLCHGRPPSFLLTIFVSSRVEGLPIMCRITTPKMYQQRCIQKKEPIQISKTFPSCKGCLFTCIILFFSFFASLCIDPVLSWSSVLYVCTRSLLWLLPSFLYGHAYCFVFCCCWGELIKLSHFSVFPGGIRKPSINRGVCHFDDDFLCFYSAVIIAQSV